MSEMMSRKLVNIYAWTNNPAVRRWRVERRLNQIRSYVKLWKDRAEHNWSKHPDDQTYGRMAKTQYRDWRRKHIAVSIIYSLFQESDGQE